MSAAARMLREELWWLTEARRRAMTECDHTPAALTRGYLCAIDAEIDDVERALDVLGWADCFDADVAGQLQLELRQ